MAIRSSIESTLLETNQIVVNHNVVIGTKEGSVKHSCDECWLVGIVQLSRIKATGLFIAWHKIGRLVGQTKNRWLHASSFWFIYVFIYLGLLRQIGPLLTRHI